MVINLNLESFRRLVASLLDRIPALFMKDLDGGILVTEETRPDPQTPGLFIMGEYVVDEPGLGCYVVLYHGSFLEVLGRSGESDWEREAWETVLHELRHHLEGKAGIRDLEREDEESIAAYRAAPRITRGRIYRGLKRKDGLKGVRKKA